MRNVPLGYRSSKSGHKNVIQRQFSINVRCECKSYLKLNVDSENSIAIYKIFTEKKEEFVVLLSVRQFKKN